MARDHYIEDVAYEMWQRGVDSDYMNEDFVSDSQDEGLSIDQAAQKEIDRTKAVRAAAQRYRDALYYST